MPAAQPRNVQQFDFYKYLRIVWRRKWLLLIPLAICVPAAITAAWVYPEEYESKAILELQDNRPQAESDTRRFGTRSVITQVQTRAMGWNSIREIVLSRKVDFGREIDPDDHRQLEKINHQVQLATKVRGLGDRHIQISHRSRSPEKNASLVNEIVKKFVGEDSKLAQDKARDDLKYYNDKLASAKARLAEIDAQFREFNQANPWLGESLDQVHREYKDAEEGELTIRRQIAGVEASLAELRKELAKTKAEIIVKRPVEVSQEIKTARKRYKDAEAQFKRVNDMFTPAHRHWRTAQQALAEAKAELEKIDSAEGAGEIEESQPNPQYAALQERITGREKEHEGLEALKLEANKKVSEAYVRQRKAPELLAEKRGLEEQRETASTTAKEYDKGVRAAEKELQRLLTEAYSSRFRVIEYARPDQRPVKDTKMKIVALGLVLGLLAGAGLVGLVEYLDQTFKSIDEARDYLGLTALGVIPAIYTPRDHRRKLWFRVLAVSSAVFVVGVAVAIYLTVPAVAQYLNVAWVKFQEWMAYW